MADEFFIDAENSGEYQQDKYDYNNIVLKQIQRCVDNLSKERLPGMETQKGYMNDVREEIINSISVLNDLMVPFAKGKQDNIKKFLGEMESKIKKLGENKIKTSKGTIQLKDCKISLPTTHPLMMERKEIECDSWKKVFAILVQAYHSNKSKIKAMEEE
ncbi:MAG: hypothetical protein ACOCUD_01725 [Bacillota bacterium]